MYKDTVTLFCRETGDRETGDTWHPTVLPNVNLMIDRASIVSQYGPESKDSAVLSVRYIMFRVMHHVFQTNQTDAELGR